jgi:hypothetical protein
MGRPQTEAPVSEQSSKSHRERLQTGDSPNTRNVVGDRGRDGHLLTAPRTGPDGRLLAHPVLISDE